MGTFREKLIEIFNQGPDNWQERLGDRISLESPGARSFDAKWRGDNSSADKKLGVFMFPRVKGNLVQDLDINSTRYSIPLYFDGKDCDTTAEEFMVEAKRNGLWAVFHPVYGNLALQLMSYKVDMNLVEVGGYVKIETEWIEPLDESELRSPSELAADINAGIDDFNISAAAEFAQKLKDATEALQAHIAYAVNGVQNIVDYALDPLFSITDSLENLMLAVNNGIQDTLDAVALEPLSLAGQVQQLIQLPALGANDIASRMRYYGEVASDLGGSLPAAGSSKAEHLNTTAVNELAMTSVIAAYAKIAVTGISAAQIGQSIASGRLTAAQIMTGFVPTIQTLPGSSTLRITSTQPLQTRAQVIVSAEQIITDFNTMVDQLDAIQEGFEGEYIDNQYFSMTQTYAQAARLVYLTVKFMLLSAFDMSVEKRVVLNRPMSPIDITVQEYGSLGDNDVYLDLFLYSNDLTGDSIYLLPAGTEVLIYA